MDNLTHTLCGLALARTGIDRTDRLATATVLIGANLPDLDVIHSILGGDLEYLTEHRGVTHSISGIALAIPLLALLMLGLSRLLPGRDKPPSRLGPLLLAAAAGLISHPLLDGLNTYGVRPWLPFDPSWLYGDICFIVDPWLWLFFAAAACLGGTRTPRESAYWVLFSGMVTLVICFATRQLPIGIPLVWCAGALVVALLRIKGLGSERRRTAAGATLLLAGCYLGLMTFASRTAEQRGVEAIRQTLPRSAQQGHTSCSPQPGIPWRFKVMLETDREIHTIQVNLRQDKVSSTTVLERRLGDPDLVGLRNTPEYRAWRSFARHPFVARQGGRLILGDARFDPRPRSSWCNIPVSICGTNR